MGLKPEDIHLHKIDTSKGHWGIFIQSIVRAQDTDSLFLKMILEQNIDDERVRMRRLEMRLLALELADSQHRDRVLGQIRNWIETTDGDGFLDLIAQSN
jgi:hypothetical protein